LCCQEHACSETCSFPEGEDTDAGEVDAETSDLCLATCQSEARDACERERADLTIIGEFVLAPIRDDTARFARVGEAIFDVDLDDLQLIQAGGRECERVVGDTRVTFAGLERDHESLEDWRVTCDE
jgi:hypothetical protein